LSSSAGSRYDSWSTQKVAVEAPAVPSTQRYESWARSASPAAPINRRSPQPPVRNTPKINPTPAKNPFDDSPEYDSAKNPFADESEVAEEAKSREVTPKKAAPSINPFGDDEEDEDYDKNLNPFGES
jgi:hypothetical protein